MTANTVSLREYLETLIEELEAQLDIKFKSTEQALFISQEVLKKDLEHLNQLRSEVTEDRGQLVRIGVFEEFKNDLALWKISAVKSITALETRYDSRIKVSEIVSVISAIISVLLFLITITKFIKG